MKTIPLTLFTMLLLCSCSCGDKGGKERTDNAELRRNQSESIQTECEDHLMKRKRQNLNISILLDLSDRIDLPQQQARDSAYILSLARAFNDHIKEKKLGLLYDKMELFFEPAPSNNKINELAEQLKIAYVKGVSKNEWMPRTTERYKTIPTQIYEQARSSSKENGYPGSDTWGFFRNHVKDYCIEACRRNILVILTDGYLYHEANKREDKNKTSYLTPRLLSRLKLDRPDWREQVKNQNLGFIPATNGLGNLEVLVIGIQNQNPNHPYAQEIIETYWQAWLKAMGVTTYKIKNADLPSHIEKVISDFIQNRT